MTVEWIDDVGAGALGQLSQSDVIGLQAQMNVDNTCLGSPRPGIAEDGVAGPETCAMAQFLNTKTGTPLTACPGAGAVGSYPADELCAMAQKPPPRPPAPPPGEEEEPPATSRATPKKKSPWGLAALGALTVVLGAFALKAG